MLLFLCPAPCLPHAVEPRGPQHCLLYPQPSACLLCSVEGPRPPVLPSHTYLHTYLLMLWSYQGTRLLPCCPLPWPPHACLHDCLMPLTPLLLVENENHCDFVKLREMLIRVNMEDLREQTHSRHYELYRRCKLEEMGFQDSDGDSQPFR